MFKQIKTKEQNPKEEGWYDTDSGNLYYFSKENQWSCRDDRVSEEYPKLWYKEVKDNTCKLTKSNSDFMELDTTSCCGIGPITNENYCPNCGNKIIRNGTI